MDFIFSIDPLLSIAVIASACYIVRSNCKENKRKNVASLKKYRIEILDKTLKQINQINQDGLKLLKKVAKEQKNITHTTDINTYLNQFLNYYNDVGKIGNLYKQDFSIWATNEQYDILNGIINISLQYHNELENFIEKTKNSENPPQESPPFFDDFVNELSSFTDALRDELNNEIANF